MARKKRSFFKLTPAERNADVARFDAGVNFEDTAPLSAAQQARFERTRQFSPAATADPGEARVLISIDPKLLVKAHTLARQEGKTFSGLVSDLLRTAERQGRQSRHRGPRAASA